MFDDAIVTVESHFGINLKRVSPTEYRSLNGCPLCGDSGKGDKSDRFRVFLEGERSRVWCRKCNYMAFVANLEKQHPLTAEERRLRRIESEQKRQAQRQIEMEHRLTALEKMSKCQDHVTYHQALNERALEYWWTEGMTSETIDEYLLGYCLRCPSYRKSASYTIPIVNRNQLENIRHRLITPNGTGKYRPHLAGLGNSLFNVNLLDTAKERIIVTEGEKKSIILAQAGYANVGITGEHSFKREWLGWFTRVNAVYVMLDPDATESAHRLGAMFGDKARIVDLPCKVDDMITRYRASSNDIEMFLQMARPVCEGRRARY